MYPAPHQITTRVFARIPADLRMAQGVNQWIEEHRKGAPTDCFIEGPSFDRNGNLYVVDIPYGRIFRISPNGKTELFTHYDGFPNGLKLHKDGRFFLADRKRGIMVADPDTGAVAPYLESANGKPFLGLNDLFFASNGDLYFTDQGNTGLQDASGRLFCLRTDGSLHCLLDNIPSPNGLVLSPTEDCLYLAVTRANCIWRVPLTPDGRATKVGIFIQMSGGIGPDGLAIDRDGNLAIAHLGLGVVWLFSPAGEPLWRITSCAGELTTNIAYGGEDGRTLFITESATGSILAADMPTAGQPLFSQQT